MNKTLLALAVTAVTAAAAVPAMAQSYGGYGGYRDGPSYDRGDYRPGYGDYRRDGYGAGINQRQAQIEQRIERGRATGAISRQEGWMLRSELRDIEQREWAYRRDGRGLSRWEVSDLNQRLDRLAMRVRYERRDNDYGYGRYGQGYGWQGGWR